MGPVDPPCGEAACIETGSAHAQAAIESKSAPILLTRAGATRWLILAGIADLGAAVFLFLRVRAYASGANGHPHSDLAIRTKNGVLACFQFTRRLS